jgi:hypothetical protein
MLAVTCASGLSLVWERWDVKVDRPPDGTTFRGAGWEVAVEIGVGVFVVSRSVAVLAFERGCPPPGDGH